MRPIVNMPEEDRATDIGNMHKKIRKDRACDSGDIFADRQTDTQTDIDYSSQYFATAPAGEVKTLTVHTFITDKCIAAFSTRDSALELGCNIDIWGKQ